MFVDKAKDTFIVPKSLVVYFLYVKMKITRMVRHQTICIRIDDLSQIFGILMQKKPLVLIFPKNTF